MVDTTDAAYTSMERDLNEEIFFSWTENCYAEQADQVSLAIGATWWNAQLPESMPCPAVVDSHSDDINNLDNLELSMW